MTGQEMIDALRSMLGKDSTLKSSRSAEHGDVKSSSFGEMKGEIVKKDVKPLSSILSGAQKRLEEKRRNCGITDSRIIGPQNCPGCGAYMVERTSRKGERFWGCSNYPRCKETLSVMTPKEFFRREHISRENRPQGELGLLSVVESDPNCPWCGGLLVVRYNRNTKEPFIGCANFHTKGCRYARNMDKAKDYSGIKKAPRNPVRHKPGIFLGLCGMCHAPLQRHPSRKYGIPLGKCSNSGCSEYGISRYIDTREEDIFHGCPFCGGKIVGECITNSCGKDGVVYHCRKFDVARGFGREGKISMSAKEKDFLCCCAAAWWFPGTMPEDLACYGGTIEAIQRFRKNLIILGGI